MFGRQTSYLRVRVALMAACCAWHGWANRAQARKDVRNGPRRILGDDGPKMVDRFLSKLTPKCPQFADIQQIEPWGDALRRRALTSIGIDLKRTVRSAVVQRVLQGPTYRIEVVRIEVFPGIFMPANVYLPTSPADNPIPLVVTPASCGAATWTLRVQRRAANLARLNMAVVVTEGFCGNGMRASLPESQRTHGYVRQLLGLKGVAFTYHIQELIATITWALKNYSFIDPARVGVAGHSYGGQVALMLAQLDKRIASVSLAATYLGDPCDGFPIKSDIAMDRRRPHHIWLPPLEVPVLPTNWRLLMVYPRPLQVSSGVYDSSAPPNVVGGALAYVQDLYSQAGFDQRIHYVTDRGNHTYSAERRSTTYGWLAHTLLAQPLQTQPETRTVLRSWDDLAVDLGETKSFAAELITKVAEERKRRYEGQTREQLRTRVTKAMKELFNSAPPQSLRRAMVFQYNRGSIHVEGHRMAGERISFPVLVLESHQQDGDDEVTLLHLSPNGSWLDASKAAALLRQYRRVVSVDYLGVGELKSERIRLHTLARYLMHNRPSLPEINIQLLHSYLASTKDEVFDIRATDWTTSFFALCLKWLMPERINKVVIHQVPKDELGYLLSGKRPPDSLLWWGLFSQITARELAAAIGKGVVEIGGTSNHGSLFFGGKDADGSK